MIIEIYGKSGSGKTVLKKCLEEKLTGYGCRCTTDVTKGWLRTIRSWGYLPCVWFEAYQFIRLRPDKYGLLDVLPTLVHICRMRRLEKLNGDRCFYVCDTALVWLVSKCKYLPSTIVKKRLYPDLVIELYVSESTRIKRKVQRSKPIPPDRKLRGESRRKKGMMVIRALKNENSSEMTQIVDLWNQRFCVPPLSKAELDSLYIEHHHSLSGNKNAAIRLSLKDQLQKAGVMWWEFDNSNDVSLDELAEEIVSRIVACR